jgi:hypothetical protein
MKAGQGKQSKATSGRYLCEARGQASLGMLKHANVLVIFIILFDENKKTLTHFFFQASHSLVALHYFNTEYGRSNLLPNKERGLGICCLQCCVVCVRVFQLQGLRWPADQIGSGRKVTVFFFSVTCHSVFHSKARIEIDKTLRNGI